MILPHHGCSPQMDDTVFVAPSADVIGEVSVGTESSIWFQTVVRGDVAPISIGSRTNIQDLSCLHVTRKVSPLTVGDEVTVGHKVMLHGCTVGNRVLIGMGATVMDDAVIGDDSVIGAGSLVTQGKTFPPRSLIVGAPAKVVRELTEDEVVRLKQSADHYVGDRLEYMEMLKK